LKRRMNRSAVSADMDRVEHAAYEVSITPELWAAQAGIHLVRTPSSGPGDTRLDRFGSADAGAVAGMLDGEVRRMSVESGRWLRDLRPG
jgi:hypothetical protein